MPASQAVAIEGLPRRGETGTRGETTGPFGMIGFLLRRRGALICYDCACTW